MAGRTSYAIHLFIALHSAYVQVVLSQLGNVGNQGCEMDLDQDVSHVAATIGGEFVCAGDDSFCVYYVSGGIFCFIRFTIFVLRTDLRKVLRPGEVLRCLNRILSIVLSQIDTTLSRAAIAIPLGEQLRRGQKEHNIVLSSLRVLTLSIRRI